MLNWIWIGLASGVGLWFLTEAASRLWLAKRGRFYSWAPHTRIRLETELEALPENDAKMDFDVNALGERGDPAPTPGENALHMLAVGGSAVECYMSDQKTQWPYRVQIELNESRSLESLGVDRVHVGNIGRSLMACGPLCSLLEGVLKNYESLDVLFMMVGSSDLVAWTEQGGPAEYEPRPMSRDQIFRSQPEGPFSWLPMRSATRRLVSGFWRAWKKPIAYHFRVGKSVQKKRDMRQAAHLITEVPDPKAMFVHYRQNLTELIRIAKTKAKRVLVVRTPWVDRQLTPEEDRNLWNFGLGRPAKETVNKYYSWEVARKLLDAMDEVTCQVAEAEGVTAIHAQKALKSDFKTFYDDLHLTPAGCEEMGACVADAIVEDWARAHQPPVTPSVSEAGAASPTAERRAQA